MAPMVRTPAYPAPSPAPDPTTAFFERLGQMGFAPSLARTSRSIGFELARDGRIDHWRLDIRRGAITVSRDADPTDCVLRMRASLFDDLATGKANAMAAALRNEISIEGDPNVLVRFQRLLPAPTGRRKAASARMIGKRRG